MYWLTHGPGHVTTGTTTTLPLDLYVHSPDADADRGHRPKVDRRMVKGPATADTCERNLAGYLGRAWLVVRRDDLV
ncbi:hypothetical protein BA895_11120 [Humibacillus sp. DSM 29435]|nr:hypothetical protein BA895_11120 [Humibacillus sp. DSM 29435]